MISIQNVILNVILHTLHYNKFMNQIMIKTIQTSGM
jgi:hypothetical protein